MKKIDRYLLSSRKHFSYSQDDDIKALKDYLSLSDLNIICVDSSLARNEVVKSSEYYVIWDTAYWDRYKRFAQVLLAILSNQSMEDNTARELNYLDAVVLEHLTYKYSYSTPDFALLLAKESISSGFNDIDFARSYTPALEQVVKLAKINVLSHEAAHIEFENHTDIEKQITDTVKNYLQYILNIEDMFKDYSDYPELRDVIAKVPSFIHGDDSRLLMELADDVYSFVEGLIFISQNLDDVSLIPMYIHSASLTRWFNQVINTADGVINYLLSSKKATDTILEHPSIIKTNYLNFFRYVLHEPVMQITLAQVYREVGFTYDEFKGIAEEIKDLRDRYNKYAAPSFDYLLRYKLHHILSNNETLLQASRLNGKRKIIDFLFSPSIK